MKKYHIFIFVFGLLVVAGCINTISQRMYQDLTNNKNYYPRAERCGECHVDIYNEWKNSKHSVSYTSEIFRKQSDEYRFKDCLPCHSPKTIFSEKIEQREQQQEEGVTCAVCHLVDGEFAGPIEHSAIVIPHPITIRTPLYKSSEICGKCHEASYQEWLSVPNEDKQNCQECHMAEIKRKVTQGTDFISNQLVKFEHEGKLRKHMFHLNEIANIENAVNTVINIATDKTKVELQVTNNIPHNIPSGSFGFRKAILFVRFISLENQEVGLFTQNFFRELGTSLKPDEVWKKELDIPLNTHFIEVSLERIGKEKLIIFHKKVNIQ